MTDDSSRSSNASLNDEKNEGVVQFIHQFKPIERLGNGRRVRRKWGRVGVPGEQMGVLV